MAYANPPVPKTYDDIVLWGNFIEMVAYKTGLARDEFDELKARVYHDFVVGEYLDIFDPTKGTFVNFFWQFIRNRVMNRFTKMNKEASVDELSPFISAAPSANEGALTEALDYFKQYPVIEYVVHYVEINQQVFEVKVSRSLYSLVLLLVSGFKAEEIALIFDLSQGQYALMLKTLRTEDNLTRFLGLLDATI